MRHNENMDISISDDQYEKLNQKAIAAGYDDAVAFIAALAGEPTGDPRGPLSDKELRESVAALEQSREDVAAGRSRDFKDALQDIADHHELKINR